MKRSCLGLISVLFIAAPHAAAQQPPISLRCVTESPAKFAGMAFSVIVDEAKRQISYNAEPSTQPSISETQIRFRHGKPPLDYDIDRVSGGFRVYAPGTTGMLGHCQLTPQRRF